MPPVAAGLMLPGHKSHSPGPPFIPALHQPAAPFFMLTVNVAACCRLLLLFGDCPPTQVKFHLRKIGVVAGRKGAAPKFSDQQVRAPAVPAVHWRRCLGAVGLAAPAAVQQRQAEGWARHSVAPRRHCRRCHAVTPACRHPSLFPEAAASSIGLLLACLSLCCAACRWRR